MRSLLSLTRTLIGPADFENTRMRTLPCLACSPVSGKNTVPFLPVSRATLMSPSVWRRSHAFLPPPIMLPNRMYLANPADPPGISRPPPRVWCADSRLSTSE